MAAGDLSSSLSLALCLSLWASLPLSLSLVLSLGLSPPLLIPHPLSGFPLTITPFRQDTEVAAGDLVRIPEQVQVEWTVRDAPLMMHYNFGY